MITAKKRRKLFYYIYSRHELSPSSRMVGMRIAEMFHWDKCRISCSRIAGETGLSPRTVSRCIRQLEQAEIFTVKRTGRSHIFKLGAEAVRAVSETYTIRKQYPFLVECSAIIGTEDDHEKKWQAERLKALQAAGIPDVLRVSRR